MVVICTGFGCLETPVVSPATIDENALLANGWTQVSLEERSFEQNISNSTSVVLNSATVKYHNERLVSEINEQIIEFKENNNMPVSIDLPESMSASIVTYRLSFPSGVKLPTGIVNKIMEKKIDEIEADNNVEDMQESTTRKIRLSDGTETIVRIFSASGNSTDSGMRIMGFVTAFVNDGSSTIVMGFVPDGEYHVELGPVNGTLFYIDGNKEINEMLELVSTIE
ncbi:MAG: hypothetical protein QCH31_05030 [Methanolobus sp.]|nr:hypothetical protein [Methanolobus sp.]